MEKFSSNNRSSNFELLKIIAIILILISHILPYCGNKQAESYVDLNKATTNFQYLILIFFRYCGQIGNAIFLVCSSYFLLESKGIKLNKVVSIIADSFIISVSILIIHLCLGYRFSIKDLLGQIFPITTKQCWFVGCYLFTYLLHPAFNVVIERLQNDKLLIFTLLLTVICMLYASDLMLFIIIYFYTALFKNNFSKYCQSVYKNCFTLFASIFALILIITITNLLGLNNEKFTYTMLVLNNVTNPVNFLIAISLFNVFGKLNFKCKAINYLSSTSLLIYLFSENTLLRRILKPYLFALIYENFTYQYIVLWCILGAVLTLIISFAVAAIYKQTIGKLIRKLIDVLLSKIKPNQKEQA